MYKVVIVEDEKIIRKGLMYSINWAELDCCIVADCENGVEGIEAIKANEPDIVIVDINMPIMDGLEMIQQTCDHYDYAAIVLSGYSDFAYAQKAMHSGVLEYLLKPLDTAELIEAIKRAKKECEMRHAFELKLNSKNEWKQINILNDYSDKATKDAVVKQMLAFIYDHYSNKIVIQDIVDELNYSETFLNHKFKEAVGTTYIEYLNRYRIQKALALLKEGGLTIQQISWDCGFGETKYFGRVFKKYIGCSPKEYVKKITN